MRKQTRSSKTSDERLFELERAENPAQRSTLGGVGAFFRVRAKRAFTNERVEIPYSRGAARRVDEATLRLFWWDRAHRSWLLVEPSGVDLPTRVVWGRIGEPGLYGAIGLPLSPALRKTLAIFAAFEAAELRARPELIPSVCGLILCRDPRTAGGTVGGGLCALCLGLEVPALHFPEVQILHRDPRPGFTPVPPKLPAPLWPTPNHGYRNTSQADVEGPKAAPLLRWTFAKGSLLSPAVIGADGTVYTAHRDGVGLSTLYALDGASGAVRWNVQLSAPGSAPVSNPVPAIGPDGTVFVNAADGALCAVNPDGSLAWRLPGAWGFPMPSPNGDVCARSGSNIVAIQPNAVQRWSTALVGIGSIFGAPRQVLAVRDDGSVVVAGERIRALDPRNGAVLWEYRPRTPLNVQAPLAVATDGRILFSEASLGLQVLDSNGVAQAPLGWISLEFSVADTGNTYLKPFFTSNDVIAVDSGGSMLWRRSFSGAIPGPPVIGRNGTVYVSQRSLGSGPHSLHALAPQSGSVLWVTATTAANHTSSQYPIAIGVSGQLVVTDVASGIVAFA